MEVVAVGHLLLDPYQIFPLGVFGLRVTQPVDVDGAVGRVELALEVQLGVVDDDVGVLAPLDDEETILEDGEGFGPPLALRMSRVERRWVDVRHCLCLCLCLCL